MDRRIRINVIGIIVIGIFMASCVTTPVERQEATTQSLTELREAMKATRAQIDRTLASLDALLSVPEAQLRDAYLQFAKDVDTITKQAALLDKESRQMKRRSEAWLSAWKETYGEVKNPELKALTEQRREQVLSRFYALDGSLAAAREAFRPFLANLQDVRKVIGIDLTPQSIAAVSSTAVVQNATQNGVAAAGALEVAITDLRSLIESLAPAPTR